MPTLLMKLSAPLQSWGAESRFTVRRTEPSPTKSGVVGMIAAALGMPRTADLSEFTPLTFGTRTDAVGRFMSDFQTAVSLPGEGNNVMPLTNRHYLQDAVFVAAVGSPDPARLERYQRALRSPVFPIYLGRRSCPPDGPVETWIREADVEQALREHPWQASEVQREARRRSERGGRVSLPLVVDAAVNAVGFQETIADEPLSFDQTGRRYATRRVVRPEPVVVELGGVEAAVDQPEHDYWTLLAEDGE